MNSRMSKSVLDFFLRVSFNEFSGYRIGFTSCVTAFGLSCEEFSLREFSLRMVLSTFHNDTLGAV